MKINKVFCYSKEIAKKNGNKYPTELLILTICLVVLIPLVGGFLGGMYDLGDVYFAIVLFSGWAFIIALFCLLWVYRTTLFNETSAYAVDTDGKVYKALSYNYDFGIYIKDVGNFPNPNRKSDFMKDPKFVISLIESSPNVSGATIYKIEKVHSVIEKKRCIKVICDYNLLIKNKMKYNKKLIIEKSYIGYEEMLSLLKNYE